MTDEPTTEVAPLKRVGGYELHRVIARGGMATVHLARRVGEGGRRREWHALKLIHSHLAIDDRFRRMLLDEARVSSKIRHKNVAQLFDSGDGAAGPYLVMELLNGAALDAIKRRAKSWDEEVPIWLISRIVSDAAKGLNAAHDLTDDEGESLGVVHRDVSAPNIFVTFDGVTKVLDFGIAYARGRLAHTETGQVKGKLAYMAPEQVRGDPVDRRADVWALGVMLWEGLTGERLFRTQNPASTVERILRHEIPKPSSIKPGISSRLEKIVMAALVRDVRDRTQTSEEMAIALDRWLDGRDKDTGQKAVAAWLENHFPDERARLVNMIGATDAGAGVTSAYQSVVAQSRTRGAVALMIGALLAVLGGWWAIRHNDANVAVARGPDTTVPNTAVLTSATARTAGAVPETNMGSAGVSSPEPSTSVSAASQTPRGSIAPEGSAGELLDDVTREEMERLREEERVEFEAAQREEAVLQAELEAERVRQAAEAAEQARAAEQATAQAAAAGSARGTRPRTDGAPRRARPAGTLNLLAIPPADVYWRGHRVGRTPLVRHALPPGAQRLELRAADGSGRRRAVRVQIRSGERTNQSVRF